jgi:hypothetical protein
LLFYDRVPSYPIVSPVCARIFYLDLSLTMSTPEVAGANEPAEPAEFAEPVSRTDFTHATYRDRVLEAALRGPGKLLEVKRAMIRKSLTIMCLF